ncbi:peptidyl-prolyl cis-trans isomerase [Neobacillus niacini]|uniref:peptidyl-prolyl cis-trans isomerase n=1 Tax=Neobacillus niacini TaxID=86668 RepID=UPI001C8DEE96|nr:peptidyl-prolyl cis-trans isomerase [Neobacillus niacini]MBY0144623.1 peptidyl-prolyl cis-trans isomerase [Neobacillus niacini]
MENILLISGKVKYSITLDPSVWIFDDRKVDLTTYFSKSMEQNNELEEYTKSISKHWDREIIEGAVYPPTLKTEKKYEKEKVLTGSFGISLQPFIKNAEPTEEAAVLVIKTSTSVHEIPLDIAQDLILGFSKSGKPLSEDGPVHVYYGDGSNQQNPIKNVREFIIK